MAYLHHSAKYGYSRNHDYWPHEGDVLSPQKTLKNLICGQAVGYSAPLLVFGACVSFVCFGTKLLPKKSKKKLIRFLLLILICIVSLDIKFLVDQIKWQF